MTKKELLNSEACKEAENVADVRITVLPHAERDGRMIPSRCIPNNVTYREADNTIVLSYTKDAPYNLPFDKYSLVNSSEFRKAPDDARIILFGFGVMVEAKDVFCYRRNSAGGVIYKVDGNPVLFNDAGLTNSIYFANPAPTRK